MVTKHEYMLSGGKRAVCRQQRKRERSGCKQERQRERKRKKE